MVLLERSDHFLPSQRQHQRIFLVFRHLQKHRRNFLSHFDLGQNRPNHPSQHFRETRKRICCRKWSFVWPSQGRSFGPFTPIGRGRIHRHYQWRRNHHSHRRRFSRRINHHPINWHRKRYGWKVRIRQHLHHWQVLVLFERSQGSSRFPYPNFPKILLRLCLCQHCRNFLSHWKLRIRKCRLLNQHICQTRERLWCQQRSPLWPSWCSIS